jgi:hypothetical protein
MSSKDLKKNSMSSIDRMVQELNKMNKKSESYKDDRFWKLEVDQAGNGLAVIRFLPSAEGEDVPWVRLFTHGFKGPGGWYIENSLTTIGKKDPVSEINTVLWNTGNDKDKEIARKQKRKLNYIANIYVVSDPKNPQNEGKVFLFKFGKQIFDKITEKLQPEFSDEDVLNPFSLRQGGKEGDPGANFKIKQRKVEGYPNFTKSEFENPSALFDGDEEKCNAILKKLYDLKQFNDPSYFKSYEELKSRLDQVLNGTMEAKSKAEEFDEFDDDVPKSKPVPQIKSKPSPKIKEVDDEDDEEESTLEYFKKLAQED